MFTQATRLFSRALSGPVGRGTLAGAAVVGACYSMAATAPVAQAEDQTYAMIKDMHERVQRIERQLSMSKYQTQLDKIAKIKVSNPTNLAIKHFDREYFEGLSSEDKEGFMAVIQTGIDNPDSGMGCYAMQPDDYQRFKPFFIEVLSEYHKVPKDAVHKNNWDLSGAKGLPADGKLNLTALGLPALSMRVRTGRNLADFPLPGAMTREDRVNLEKKMCVAFEELIKDPAYGGRYYSLTPGHPSQIDEAKYKELVADHIMFKDMSADPYLTSAGISGDWPYGRGCYVSKDKDL